MGGIAAIAKEAGHEVSGADQNVYPPMSTQLRRSASSSCRATTREVDARCRLRRRRQRAVAGQPVVEALLDSGPPLLLRARSGSPSTCCATAGCSRCRARTARPRPRACWRGSSSTRGSRPGFPDRRRARATSASRRGSAASPYFVVEADEYDTAFFDKRSKFVHYRPRTLIVNNIEYDHADIFRRRRRDHLAVPSVAAHGAAQRLDRRERCRTRTSTPARARCLDAASRRSARTTAGATGRGATTRSARESRFSVAERRRARSAARLCQLLGAHNLENALAAIAAASHVGVAPEVALAALARFKGVKRRLELRGHSAASALYEDFAHHPTAIATTLAGLKSRRRRRTRIVAVMEPRSNTMRMGVHRDTLAQSFEAADRVFVLGGAAARLGPGRDARGARPAPRRGGRRRRAARAPAGGARAPAIRSC